MSVLGERRPQREGLLDEGGGGVEGEASGDWCCVERPVSGGLGELLGCAHGLTEACLTRVQI